MNESVKTVAYRTVAEWTLESQQAYANPFADVALDATFVAPSGQTVTVPGFYDGDATWRVRFSPNEVGQWLYTTSARPADPDLATMGAFEVTEEETRGFLQATPGQAWGFCYESGEPVFLLGDTVYNLLGMAHCDGDVEGFLLRRASQGFNLFRVRLPVSPYHPPEAYSEWQTRRTWPWGGSAQTPRFDRFNLAYFGTVDRVVQLAEELDVGFEAIMEAWGFEFPFNNRALFVPEWEELWLRYLIARYDAYNCIYFWTLQNEYEHYPDGDWRHNPLADRWAMRVGRWVKGLAQHRHVIAVHNGPRQPPFAERFRADPEAIDAIMFQAWGTTDAERGWLAAGIEDDIQSALKDWPGSAVFAEYGYERNPDLPLVFPGFRHTDANHNRRGAWRGAFSGLGVINGFENSWGPAMILDQDQEGVAYLQNVRHFFTSVVPFSRMQPAPDLLVPGEWEPGCRPLVLSTEKRDVVAVYLPVVGEADLELEGDREYDAQWYDPRTGELSSATEAREDRVPEFVAPPAPEDDLPCDWVLVLHERVVE